MTPTHRDLDDPEGFSAPAAMAAAGYGGVATLPFVGSRPHVGLASTARRVVLHVADALLAWHERARQRRALLTLSEHMLRDIGISRADALGEAAKPFWRN